MSKYKAIISATLIAVSTPVSAQEVADEMTFDMMSACAEIYLGASHFHEKAGRTRDVEISTSKASTMSILMGSMMLRQNAPSSINDWSFKSQQIDETITNHRAETRKKLTPDGEPTTEAAAALFKEWLPYCDGELPRAEQRLLSEISWQSQHAAVISRQ
jgi:hypothetical protein